MELDLRGKVAVVTGGGQGLGEATCRSLGGAGAAVVVNFFDEPTGANRAKAEVVADSLGDRAWAGPADVRERGQLESLFAQTVSRFGRLDIVVNNAGIIRDRSVRKMTPDEWQSVLDTNLTGVFNVCQIAQTHLASGGRIVNLASISGVIGFFGQANYSSAKAGVIALTKVLSKELAPRQITVNAIAPGVVLTDMGQTIPEDVRQQMLSQIPLRRFGEASDIANAITFLCSPLASYITGQTLHVNGGWWG